MSQKPTTAEGYPPELAIEARRMCLYIATILGDLADEIVVVGGLVPYLIIEQEKIEPASRHVGTRDLDLGLSVAVLDEQRYRQIAERLRERGFEQALNESGNRTWQTWRLEKESITVDFLIPSTNEGQRAGSLQNLESDFAAIVTPALNAAFVDFLEVRITDLTPHGERATRTVRVCGPAAFVVMKAHAFRLRGENKDAYDLVYVLLNHGATPVLGVAESFARVAHLPESAVALSFLDEDFSSADAVGPRRRAEFLGDRDDPSLCQDAFGVVRSFLTRIEGARGLSKRNRPPG